MSNEYNYKHENKILSSVVSLYIKTHGKQPASLDSFKFSIIDDEIFYPDKYGIEDIQKIRQSINHLYIQSLEMQGYVRISNDPSAYSYSLTYSGYEEGLRINNPLIHLAKDKWHILLPITLSFVIALIAVIRLTKCT